VHHTTETIAIRVARHQGCFAPEYQWYQADYNTRVVVRSMPSLDTLPLPGPRD
jgi:hypothetical protein